MRPGLELLIICVDRFFRDSATPARKPVGAKAIRDHVAKYFGLPPRMLASRSRQRKVHYPRQIGMHLARKHTQESLESIGQLYNRGHASVLNALRSLEKKMGISARIAREVRFIEEKLLEKI
jgi:chromosomal replication initiator protein